jgi:hypothetical protein
VRFTISSRLFGALVALIVAAAFFVTPSSPQSVDNRTYLEMIDGVSRHGLPYTTNGPVATHRELQARWNRYANGRLWGALPPVFPYLAAPFYRLGGAHAVVRLNVLLLALLALAVARLTQRLTNDPLVGAGAAWASLSTTAVATLAVDTSPYTLAITGVAWCVERAVASLDTRSVRDAGLSGLCAGAAVGSHPLCFPMVAPVVAALFVATARDEALPPWVFTTMSLRRGASALAGVAVVLVPVAVLNHVRFGLWNPVSYGPCVWRSCAETGLDQQGIGAMLHWARPVLLWATVALTTWALVRRSRAASFTVVALALGVLSLPSELRSKTAAIAALAWGFIVDVSPLTLRQAFVRHPDGLGVFLGPFVVKSLLQCTPVTLLAVFAVTQTRERFTRHAVVLVGLSCLGLLISLALRANLPVAFALGYPFLYLRYVVPALPLTTALVAVSVRSLPWRRAHLALGGLVAVAMMYTLSRWSHDDASTRRVLLLRVPLVVAAVAFVLTARALAARGDARHTLTQHLATVSVTLAIAASVAVSLGVDLREVMNVRRDHEQRVQAIARQLPVRFALVGYPVEIDPVLELRATRDVEYIDLYETRDWAVVRALYDVWTRARRPVFVLQPPQVPYASPMPDLCFVAIDRSRGLYRMELAPNR